MSPAFFSASNDDSLAYHYHPATQDGFPTVVFLGGFMSDMGGSKALALDTFCREQGYGFLRFDYQGHGQSSGEFQDGTIGRWKHNAVEIIAEKTHGPIILIGSSMGGWIMLHAALSNALSTRIYALIGIAAAPDFADRMWDELTKTQQDEINLQGMTYLPNCYDDGPGYPITKALVDDGFAQALLKGDSPLPITCPVRLFQGMQDADVPWQSAITLAEKLASDDVQLHLLKDGDHRLSSPEQLTQLMEILQSVMPQKSNK